MQVKNPLLLLQIMPLLLCFCWLLQILVCLYLMRLGLVCWSSINQTPIANVLASSSALEWSSLFRKMPKNAGEYVPCEFKNVEVDGALVPPMKLLQASMECWSEYLVGIFLDSNPNYQLVKARCNQVWKPLRGLSCFYDYSMYFLKFARNDERQSILELDPIIT